MNFWHWYRPYNEKSARAMERERSATENFDSLRQGLEHTMFQYKIRTLGLGVLDPGSVLHDCPEVVMDKILAYAKPKGYDEYDPSQVTINPIGFPRPKASANIQVPTVVKRDIKTFFQPGEKHVFPLLLPSEHLTGSWLCTNDFAFASPTRHASRSLSARFYAHRTLLARLFALRPFVP